jgi:hypothetical protein
LLRFLAGGLLRLLIRARSSIDSTTSGRSLPKRLKHSSSINVGSGSFQGSCCGYRACRASWDSCRARAPSEHGHVTVCGACARRSTLAGARGCASEPWPLIPRAPSGGTPRSSRPRPAEDREAADREWESPAASGPAGKWRRSAHRLSCRSARRLPQRRGSRPRTGHPRCSSIIV